MIPEEITALDGWLRRRDFRYYALNHVPAGRVLRAIAGKNRWGGVAWRQLFRMMPLNPRPLLGERPDITDSQATVIMALAYLELAGRYPGSPFADAFRKTLARVKGLRSAKTRHFAVRQGKQLFLKLYAAAPDDITPLWTAWAGRLFTAAYRQYRDPEYLAAARDTADYFLHEHPREEAAQTAYFSYDPGSSFKVWNASGDIAAFLVRFGAVFSDSRAIALGVKGLNLISDVQQRNGAWLYGLDDRYIDNFHTALILRALAEALQHIRSQRLQSSLSRGMTYYLENLFVRDGEDILRPRHFDPRRWPRNSSLVQKVDIRDCALPVILFSEMAGGDARFSRHADAVLAWANRHMRRGPTYCAEKTWLWTNSIPYIEFQAWMLLALVRRFTSGQRS